MNRPKRMVGLKVLIPSFFPFNKMLLGYMFTLKYIVLTQALVEMKNQKSVTMASVFFRKLSEFSDELLRPCSALTPRQAGEQVHIHTVRGP